MPAVAMSTTPIPNAHSNDNVTPVSSFSPLASSSSSRYTSQWLFTEDELLLAPSITCGMSSTEERQNRAKGVNFILQVGILLKLPQITLATASVFLHRFFMRHSMRGDPAARIREYHYYSVAAAALWLAAKVEENCRKMKELVVACVRVAQKDPNKLVDEQTKEYWRWRDTILALEDVMLEGLCFDLSLEPPYKALFDMLCQFDVQDNKELRNAAWAFVNDSCLTPLCLLWSSRTIAASSMYAAARSCGVDFPDDENGKPWWEMIGVSLRDIRKACNFMADVYENAPLRGGADGSIYQRTPEIGDEKTAKTRMPGQSSSNGANGRGMRETSVLSAAGSDVSKKRGRHDNEEHSNRSQRQPVSMNQVPWGGDHMNGRDAKRTKQDMDLDQEPDAKKGTGDAASTYVKAEDTQVAKMSIDGANLRGFPVEPGLEQSDESEQPQRGLVSPDLAGSEEGELDD